MPLPVPKNFNPSEEPDGELNLPSAPRSIAEPVTNDETFESLTIDELMNDPELDEEEKLNERRWSPPSSGATAYEPSKSSVDDDDWSYIDDLTVSEPSEVDEVNASTIEPVNVAPPVETSKSSRGRKKKVKENRPTDFVDKKSKKLLPFGRKTSIDPSTFDKRTDLKKKAKRVQFAILAGLAVLMALGVKNALVPPSVLDEEEVAAIAVEANGGTGFPLNSGEGFARDFMKAYLSINNNEGDQKVLGYFYSGSLKESEQPTNTVQSASRFRQTVIAGPTVYSRTALTPYSGSYTVGALVQPADTNAPAPNDGSTLRWMFFNVDVYYDAETGRFAIPQGSPSIVPGPRPKSPSDLPEQAPVSTSDPSDELKAEVEATVVGFLKGYAVSSIDDHTAIDQYVTDPKDFKLVSGLEKQYVLSEGRPSDFNAYPGENPDEVKIDLTVEWKSVVNSESNATYSSRYVMTLQKGADGKYLVSRFAPLHYQALEE